MEREVEADGFGDEQPTQTQHGQRQSDSDGLRVEGHRIAERAISLSAVQMRMAKTATAEFESEAVRKCVLSMSFESDGDDGVMVAVSEW